MPPPVYLKAIYMVPDEQYLTTKTGTYKGYPYRSWSNGGFSDGFSDHFPVYVYVIKEVN